MSVKNVMNSLFDFAMKNEKLSDIERKIITDVIYKYNHDTLTESYLEELLKGELNHVEPNVRVMVNCLTTINGQQTAGKRKKRTSRLFKTKKTKKTKKKKMKGGVKTGVNPYPKLPESDLPEELFSLPVYDRPTAPPQYVTRQEVITSRLSLLALAVLIVAAFSLKS